MILETFKCLLFNSLISKYLISFQKNGKRRLSFFPDGRLLFYPVHELYNGVAYPVYHRVDLRVNRHFQMKKGRISTYLHIINLYNQKNLRKYDLNATHLDTDELIPDGKGGYITPRGDKYWFGITPVIGVNWEF